MPHLLERQLHSWCTGQLEEQVCFSERCPQSDYVADVTHLKLWASVVRIFVLYLF